MLTFEQKIAIFDSFPELQRKNISLGRVNYHYEQSAYDKKTVVYHLHPNGNGYVFAGLLPDCDTDDKGMVNIRDYSEDELRSIVQRSIRSLSPKTAEQQTISESEGVQSEQRWIGPGEHTLLLVQEDDLWYVYSGLNLDMAFETREEAEEYLREEGYRAV